MKKLFYLLLLTCIFSLAACDSATNTVESTTALEQTTNTVETTFSETTISETTTEEFTTIEQIIPTIEIINISSTYETIDFEVTENDPSNIGSIISISLYFENQKQYELIDLEQRQFIGLTSETNYTIKLVYEYEYNNVMNQLLVSSSKETKVLRTPNVSLDSLDTTVSSVQVSLSVTDEDITYTVTEIGIYLNSILINKHENTNTAIFYDLLSDTEYEIQVLIEYDFNDGLGIHLYEYSLTERTYPIYVSDHEYCIINIVSTSNSIIFELNDYYPIQYIVKLELLLDEEVVATITDYSNLIFEGLQTNTEYVIHLVYEAEYPYPHGISSMESQAMVVTLVEVNEE